LRTKKRCFIVGNGPSLTKAQIKSIASEDSFAVNLIYKTEFYEILQPKYYVAADKHMYEGDYYHDLVDLISNNKFNTKFIFTRRAIKKFSFLEKNNIFYIYGTMISCTSKLRYDLAKNASNFLNVLPFCIMCAIYMGYKEIILLGCDFNEFASSKPNHYYDDNEEKLPISLLETLQGHAIVCMQHYRLNSFAKKNEITIVNASGTTLLDAYPCVDFSNFLKERE
jgi:hypothetical protein